MKNKALIIVMDGLGDRPIAEFGRLTPLEKARTPFLDKLASEGMCAMVDPLTPGMPVSTHTGMALLMGLAPKDASHLSRGPVEAAGIHLPVQQGDVILRCNFAHLETAPSGLKVLDRRAGRISEDTSLLAKSLSHIDLPYGIQGQLHPTTQHRAVLHLRGEGLSSRVSDTDCERITPAMMQQCRPLVNKKSAQQTAEIINHFSQQAHEILKQHPLNQQRMAAGKVPASGILCRSAGKMRYLHNCLKYCHLKVAVISAEATIHGLSHLFGFNSISKAEFTALPDTDLALKVKVASDALQDHDMVYLHIKGTDICSHDQQPRQKLQFIQRIDAALSQIDWQNHIIGVTADHSTNSNSGLHCGDPVPSLIYAPQGRYDKCHQFSESVCMGGGLGRLSASNFLLTILDQMDVLHNYKIEDTPYIQPLHVTPKIISDPMS